jgi:hypothetical protein
MSFKDQAITPAGSTAMTVEDEKFLEQMAEKANEGIGGGSSLPQVKMNSKKNSKKFQLGEWVMGQQTTKEGNKTIISEEGIPVKSVVVLKVKNCWTKFAPNGGGIIAQSSLFDDFKDSNLDGKNRQWFKDNGYDIQKVAFFAVPVSKEKVEIGVAFFKSSAFFPFINLQKILIKYENSKGEKKPCPIYSYPVGLSSTLETNDNGQDYYVPVFERGPIFSTEVIKKFEKLANEISELIASGDFRGSKSDDVDGVDAKPIDQHGQGDEPYTNYSGANQSKSVREQQPPEEKFEKIVTDEKEEESEKSEDDNPWANSPFFSK